MEKYLPHVILANLFSNQVLKGIGGLIALIGIILVTIGLFNENVKLHTINDILFVTFLIILLAIKEKEIMELKKKLSEKQPE